MALSQSNTGGRRGVATTLTAEVFKDVITALRSDDNSTRVLDKRGSPRVGLRTKLAELKIQMLAEASKDAHTRAEQIATQAKSRLGSLLTARMGVMQINPANSSEVSAEGNNDKTSLDKDVLAVVSATFGVE